MTDETVERRTLHCLRHRPTGKLLRVAEDTTVLVEDEPYRSEETTYRLTLEEGWPLYDAGSARGLAAALHPGYGTSARAPLDGGFGREDLEPVVMEETVTRAIRPAGVSFDPHVRMDALGMVPVRPRLARSVDGLADVLDAVEEHRADIEAVPTPGEGYAWGEFHLVAYVLASHERPDEDVLGALVTPGRHAAPKRRGLAVLEAPRVVAAQAVGETEDLPAYPLLLLCLSDERPLPEALVEALRAPAGPNPGP